MTYKVYIHKYMGMKAHFEIDPEGSYMLDFTGKTYSNVEVLEVHDEFVILFDQVDKSKIIIPYALMVIRF